MPSGPERRHFAGAPAGARFARRQGTGSYSMIRSFFASAGAILLLASAASAEPEPGSRIDTNRGSVGGIDNENAETAIRVMNTFGRCVARNRSRRAEEILALPLYSREQGALTRRVIGGEDGCMGAGDRQLSFSPPLLVGAMAEWFVLQRHDSRDLGDISRISDERLGEVGLTPRTGYEDFAICVVRRDAAAVRELIRTRPASDDERGVVSRLSPHLGPCLPEGGSFTFNRPSLRGILAAGLYRVLSVMEASPQAQASR